MYFLFCFVCVGPVFFWLIYLKFLWRSSCSMAWGDNKTTFSLPVDCINQRMWKNYGKFTQLRTAVSGYRMDIVHQWKVRWISLTPPPLPFSWYMGWPLLIFCLHFSEEARMVRNVRIFLFFNFKPYSFYLSYPWTKRLGWCEREEDYSISLFKKGHNFSNKQRQAHGPLETCWGWYGRAPFCMRYPFFWVGEYSQNHCVYTWRF